MSRKSMQRQMVREAEDRRRHAEEVIRYQDAQAGAPCPRCAEVARTHRRDLDRGMGMGAVAIESCWLCQDTGSVVRDA